MTTVLLVPATGTVVHEGAVRFVVDRNCHPVKLTGQATRKPLTERSSVRLGTGLTG